MKIPIIYNLRSLRQRPASTLTTALGMALVVAVFWGVTATLLVGLALYVLALSALSVREPA